MDLSDIYELNSKNPRQAAEQLLDTLEEKLQRSQFNDVQDMLNVIDVTKLEPSVLLVVLTITAHGKSHLPERESLLSVVRHR